MLGASAIAGAPMLLLLFLSSTQFENLQAATANSWVSLLGVFYIGGWICGAIGMFRRKIYGETLAGKIIFTLQMILLTLAFLFSVQEAYGINYENGGVFFRICDAAYPNSHLFMIIVGIFTIRAKKWPRFATFAPLLVGFSLPVSFLVSGIVLESLFGMIFFGSLTAIGLGTIGWKIFKN